MFPKFLMSMCQRQNCRIISQNPEYVKIHCKNRRILFHFECRKRILDNQSR